MVGLAFGMLFGVGRAYLGQNAIMVFAGLIGVGLTLAAATRFWSVVVLLFVVRSSLDSFKLGGAAPPADAATAANGANAAASANTLDPGVVVALVFLMAATMWLIAQWRAGELRPASRPTKWFAALAAVGLVSAAGSGYPVGSFQTGLKICAGALMLAVLEQVYLSRPDRGRHVLAAGAASLLYPAYVAFRQLTGTSGVEQYLEVSRIRGTFVHSNSFATFLVIVAVMALALRPHLRGWSRLAANVTFALSATLTLFTYARGAWIALVLGMILIGVCQDRRLLGLVIVAIFAVAIFVPSVSTRLSDLNKPRVEGRGDPNSLAWRVSYWGRLLPMTAENPITGIGLDEVVRRTPEKLMPHNSFVQALVETGVVGLTCLLGLIFSTGRALRDAIRGAPPGLARGMAIGAAAAGLGWLSQLISENLLTQAAIYWYLVAPIAWVLADRARRATAAEDPLGSVAADDIEGGAVGRAGAVDRGGAVGRGGAVTAGGHRPAVALEPAHVWLARENR
jgi:O-antigen ligase